MTEFRSTVLCKHTRNSNPSKAKESKKTKVKPPFRPSNHSEAKDLLVRKIEWEARDTGTEKESDEPHGSKPRWNTSSKGASETLRIKYFMNSPPEKAIKADRKYVREMIQRNKTKFLKSPTVLQK